MTRRPGLGEPLRCAGGVAGPTLERAGPSHRARRAGLHRSAPDGSRRPSPPPACRRPDGPHPDRLGQRAGAQPGAAAVRAARAAPAQPDRRRHTRRRAVRVLGARGEPRARRAAPVDALEDERRPSVEGGHAAPAASTAVRGRRRAEDPRRRAGRGGVDSINASGPRGPGGTGTTARSRSSTSSAPASSLRSGVRATSPASTTSPSGCCPPTSSRSRRRRSTTRARSCSCGPRSTTAWRRSRTSPTTTVSATRPAGR